MNESLFSEFQLLLKKHKIKPEVLAQVKKFNAKWDSMPGMRTQRLLDVQLKKLAKKYESDFGGDAYRIIKGMFDQLNAKANKHNYAKPDTSWGTHKMRFAEWVEEQDRLDERLIVLNNSKKYNNIIILAGGAGSGKGFALSNFIDASGYKVRDVDEIKRLVQRISELGKIDARKIWTKEAQAKFDSKTAKTVSKVLAQNNYRLDHLILKEPDHVLTLHIITDLIGWKKKSLTLLSKTIPTNSDHKPNIVFDMTAKDRKSIEKTVQTMLDIGYESANIHLVWVLTDYQIAIQQNAQRKRVVPADILLQTHKGAANTMVDLIGGTVPRGIDGDIWVILNNKENTLYWKRGDGSLKGTPEFHEDSSNQKIVAKVDQDKYDRIYGKGAFAKRNKRTGGDFEKEKAVIKSFARIRVKKAGKTIGQDVLPFKTQLFNWVIKNVPANAVHAIRRSFGIILGKDHGAKLK